MQVLQSLENGPDMGLLWLFYALLGFMVLTIIVGSFGGGRASEAAKSFEDEGEEAAVGAKTAARTKLQKNIGRASARKKKG